MKKLLKKLETLLYRKYGIDELSYFLIFIALVSSILNRFKFNVLYNIIHFILFLIIIYRLFSTNYAVRRRENTFFLKSVEPITKRVKMLVKNYKDTNYKYFTCSNCHQNFRVPKHKGTIIVTCPKCHNKYTKRT